MWRERRETLSESDSFAMDLYRQLSDPVVKDLGLTALVFDSHGLTMSRDSIGALVSRLSAVHRYTLDMIERARQEQRESNG